MKEEQKKELLGCVNPLSVGGGKEPDMAELASPFKYSGAIIKTFCTECGNILEIENIDGLADLAYKAGIVGGNDLKSKYFKVNKCLFCSHGFAEVELKEIV